MIEGDGKREEDGRDTEMQVGEKYDGEKREEDGRKMQRGEKNDGEKRKRERGRTRTSLVSVALNVLVNP